MSSNARSITHRLPAQCPIDVGLNDVIAFPADHFGYSLTENLLPIEAEEFLVSTVHTAVSPPGIHIADQRRDTIRYHLQFGGAALHELGSTQSRGGEGSKCRRRAGFRRRKTSLCARTLN